MVPLISVLLLSSTGLVTLYLIIYRAVLVVYHLKIETNLRNRLLLYSDNSPRVFLIKVLCAGGSVDPQNTPPGLVLKSFEFICKGLITIMSHHTSIIDNWEDMAYKKRYFDLPTKNYKNGC